MNTTVLDIVKSYIEQGGYGGLADGMGCGCPLWDFHTCGSEFHDCQPAYEGVDEEGDLYMYLSKEDAEASKQGSST